MSLNYRQIASIFATLLIIILIFQKGNFNDLYNILNKLDFIYLIFASISYICFTTLIGFRFYFLVGNKISFSKVLKSHFGSMLLSDVTPGRLGYFTIVHHLKEKIDVEESTNYVLLGQLNDFGNKLISIIIFSMLLGSSLLDKDTIKFVIIFTFFSLILLLSLTYGIGIPYISRKLQLPSKVFQFLENLKKYAIYDPIKLLKFVSVTTFAWLFLGSFWYFSALAIGIYDFSIFYHMILHGLASVLSFLPIVLGGIGLQEATLVTILDLEGIEYDLALGFVILTRGINVLFDLVLGIKFVWGVND